MNDSDLVKEWVREIDSKLDKVIESIARIEVHSSRDSDKLGSHSNRIKTLEDNLQEFAKEHQYVKGQLRMVTIIGGAIVGMAIIAEVVIMVMK